MSSHRYKFFHTNRNICILFHCINNYIFPRIQRIFLPYPKPRLNTSSKHLYTTLQSVFPFFSAHIHMKMLTDFTCLPHWCINSHRNGKLLKIITKVSRSIRTLRNPSAHSWTEFCAVWWDSCVKLMNFRQINPKELELFHFTHTDKLLWHFVALKNLFHFRCVCGCGIYQICLLELCSDWEILRCPSHVPCVMSLINQDNPPVLKGVGRRNKLVPCWMHLHPSVSLAEGLCYFMHCEAFEGWDTCGDALQRTSLAVRGWQGIDL